MSTAEGRDSVQGSQHRADGCVDCDPGLVGLPVIPAEGTSVVLSAAAFLVSQVVTKALQEVENEQQGAEHTVEEDWDVWSSEQEEDLEEEQEEQGYESEEEEDADEGAEHVEEVQEEGARVVLGAREAPMVGFPFPFWDLAQILLHHIRSDNHVLGRPHAGRVVVRRGPQEPKLGTRASGG